MQSKTKKRFKLQRWRWVAAFLTFADLLSAAGGYFLALWFRFDCRYSSIHHEYIGEWSKTLQEELPKAGVLSSDYDFEAYKRLVPMQPGDVPITYADVAPLERGTGFKPMTSLREGLRRFAKWYAEFYLAKEWR